MHIGRYITAILRNPYHATTKQLTQTKCSDWWLRSLGVIAGILTISIITRTVLRQHAQYGRTALAFHGLLRSSEDTAPFWKKYVIEDIPNIDTYYFGPDTWYPEVMAQLDPVKDFTVSQANKARKKKHRLSRGAAKALWGKSVIAEQFYSQNLSEVQALMQKVYQNTEIAANSSQLTD